jgi:hypothetical protein
MFEIEEGEEWEEWEEWEEGKNTEVVALVWGFFRVFTMRKCSRKILYWM